jgi:hypothetical protein
MDKLFVFPLFLIGLLLVSCGDPTIPAAYRAELPELPPLWKDSLGETRWRLTWVNPQGRLSSAEGTASSLPEIDLAPEHAVPVLAQPFWPSLGLHPGALRYAGAIFPRDARRDGAIRLSWEAGIDAAFYLALAEAAAHNASSDGSATGSTAAGSAANKRRPELFDWKRFRELLESADIPLEIREDPWLADWQAVAAKTVESGWDRRRVKAVEKTPVKLTLPADGPWFSASPFAPVREWRAGETVTLDAGDSPELLLSPGGMLRYTKSSWVWAAW